MWQITKDFYLEYGHRVWSQKLETDFCAIGDTACACRHLHGHSGKVCITLSGDELTRGMVTDFKHLGFMKDYIDNYLDHKMIIDRQDPAFVEIVGGNIKPTPHGDVLITQTGVRLPLIDVKMGGISFGQVINLVGQSDYLTGYHMELLEGFFIVDFLPTSEALAKYIAEVAQAKLKSLDVTVSQVEWNETPKSHALYIA